MTILEERPPITETDHTGTDHVKSRSISGVKILTIRTLVSLALRVVSSLVLARLLFPKDYGLFGIVAYVTGLGMFLCDVGLTGALIRQPQKPTRNEAFTVFVFQQTFAALAVAIVIATAPLLLHLYHLPPQALPLLAVMAFSLFFSSLRVVPMMALERDLNFPVIARCELIENVVQTVGTIAFAYLGWGAWALAGGGLLRGAVGLLLVWAASPWQPAGRFEFAIVKRLARFGIAFQLNALVPSIISGWMPLVVGRILGVTAFGLVGWATNLASVPLMLSAVLNRVAFPAYSRLQADPDALARHLGSSIRRISAVFCLVIPLIVIGCPVGIPLLFHARWIPATTLVQWFSLECAVLTLTGLFASAQNATGHSGERLGVTLGVGALRWGLGYRVVKLLGLAGIGPTVFLISLSEMCISGFLIARRSPGCSRLLAETLAPLLTVGVMLAAALGAGWAVVHEHGWLQMVVSLVVFAALMTLREIATGGHIIYKEMRALLGMLRPARLIETS